MNTRRPASALVEPGKLPLDRFGNIPAGALARLAAAAKRGPARRAKKGQARRDGGIVYIRGASPQAHGRDGGFFQRTADHRLVRLTAFAAHATYRPRFGFRGRVERAAAATFASRLLARLAEAIATAK